MTTFGTGDGVEIVCHGGSNWGIRRGRQDTSAFSLLYLFLSHQLIVKFSDFGV
jgi:hypothetical protein